LAKHATKNYIVYFLSNATIFFMITLKKLIKTADSKNITISAAESASGGYLSYLLTKTPGSSTFFKGSVVVYSLESKNKLLKIPLPRLVKTQGVSEEIAKILANNSRKLFNSTLAVSITGFAGPDSACGLKPGTIFIGIASKNFCRVKKFQFKGSRDEVRKLSAKSAIDLIWEDIK
jgi:nicotinamide-nucleotide amidase